MVHLDMNFRICVSLFGWKENKQQIVQCKPSQQQCQQCKQLIVRCYLHL